MITIDVIMFGLMSLGLASILIVGWSMHAWKKIKEKQKRIDKLNERVQRLLDGEEINESR
jgi:biopolymer transport protein ExbB/TolQ